MPPPDRFTAVRFPVVHPSLPVAADTVVMAFHDAADAAAFREWWETQGTEVFAHWLKRQSPRPEIDRAGHQWAPTTFADECVRCGTTRGTMPASMMCRGRHK